MKSGHHRRDSYSNLPLFFSDPVPDRVDSLPSDTDHHREPRNPADGESGVRLETDFDPTFTARLALREKQIQQNYRPVIGVHKWFARRPGTVFRSLLLTEFNGTEPIDSSYWRAHEFSGVIADPFMGGGTPLIEANRLGFSVVGADINPMAYWIVRQSLTPLDLEQFGAVAERVAADVESEIGLYYQTRCMKCARQAQVKYFLWVKVGDCPLCQAENDLFPGYLIAEATRHPRHVVVCGSCGALNECTHQPTAVEAAPCNCCGASIHIEGPARRNRIRCCACSSQFSYPSKKPGPPRHRLFAIEYHCEHCKATYVGRFFKAPDSEDLAAVESATARLAELDGTLLIPTDAIPPGDETDRLHRWGYRHYREMFHPRQLVGLGLLLRRIQAEADRALRHALLTVFSDFLRYQNLLCRYDTYALKCQDIFSVHGFPVGLIQCENNLLGIPHVGSGAFRHFVEKYRRAKAYCLNPFETRYAGTRKETIQITGEQIRAELVDGMPDGNRGAWLNASPATDVLLSPDCLDGVFTDPPYYDNVQYAELMDFCFVWLRQVLGDEIVAFRSSSTRSPKELTGNTTLGRGLDHFTAGVSAVFSHYAQALKTGAPFVFTYHHNDAAAYLPLVVAILDAGLDCTATLPAPAEMGASLHIARTGSSILDSVFVCRRDAAPRDTRSLMEALEADVAAMARAGIRVSDGDRRCLRAGHVARTAINELRANWDPDKPLYERMNRGRAAIQSAELSCRTHTSAADGRSKESGLATAV